MTDKEMLFHFLKPTFLAPKRINLRK